jgi:flavin reductase (DIM6/NTAB) family NADH-FMN oxidoreductase RutF
MDNRVMFKLSYGLYLLTVNDGKKDTGCITNTVVQLTSKPNRISVALNKLSYTHEVLLKTGEFNVSVLTEEAPFKVFQHFGFQSGRAAEKFKDCDADAPRAENGLIYLPKYINAYISGKVISKTDLGTHTLFIADVSGGELISDAASVTYDYYQKNIKPDNRAKKGWRCTICGYIHEGENLPEDFICPLCNHDASYFEKII